MPTHPSAPPPRGRDGRVAAAVAYRDVLRSYFWHDDFAWLFVLHERGLTEFLLTPLGGHTLVARNAVFGRPRCAAAARRPCSSTRPRRDARRFPGRGAPAHSGVKRTGMCLMPFTKPERSRDTGPSSSMSGRRRSSSSNMIRISSRARWAPRQKCGPMPNPR